MDDLKHNGSGYIDPTAEKALRGVTAAEKRQLKMDLYFREAEKYMEIAKRDDNIKALRNAIWYLNQIRRLKTRETTHS